MELKVKRSFIRNGRSDVIVKLALVLQYYLINCGQYFRVRVLSTFSLLYDLVESKLLHSINSMIYIYIITPMIF